MNRASSTAANLRFTKVIGILRNGRSKSPGTGDRNGPESAIEISGMRNRFLVAPHHGRKSGYCKAMMDAVEPHATIISDIWGASETHRAFRSDPLGVQFESGEIVKYYTTKRGGRVQVIVSARGIRIAQ